MNAEHPLGRMLQEALREALRARIEERNKVRAAQDSKVRAAQDSMIRAGYSREEVDQFLCLHSSMNDMLGALACTQTLAMACRDVPSAATTVHLASYLINSVAWMYGVLERAHVDPEVFGMKGDEAEFIHLMERARNEAQTLLNEVAETVAG